MQKGSIAVLFLMVFAIIIVGGYYFLNLPKSQPEARLDSAKRAGPPLAENSTEKIYTDSALGFEFHHNKDLIVKEDTEQEFNKRGNGDFRKNFKGYVEYEPGKFLGAVVGLDKTNSYDTNPFTVWVFDNLDNLSIDSWHHKYWYYPFVWGDFTYTGKFTLAPKTEATISGQMAKSGIIDYQPGKPKFIYLSKDKKMYLFRVIGQNGDQILSTFKFIP